MGSFLEKLMNRSKLQLIVATIISLIAVDGLGIDLAADTIQMIAGLVVSYVIGQGIADAGNGGSQ